MALLFLAVGHLSVSYLWNQGSRNPAAVIRRVLLPLNLGKLPGPQLMSTSDSSSSKSSAFRSAALFSTIGVWRTIGSVTCGISLKFPPVGQSRAIRSSPGRGKTDCARLTLATQCCQYRKKSPKKGQKSPNSIFLAIFGPFLAIHGTRIM